MSPAISINKGCCCHQPLWLLSVVYPEGIQDGGEQDTDLRQCNLDRCKLRNDFSEPRPLRLPIHRKGLNSLPGSVCFFFSLVSSNLLMFNLFSFSPSKNSYISCLLPYLIGTVPPRELRGCHPSLCWCGLVIQLCSTLCDPMDCSPPCSSVCGILQARILEWVARPFSRESSRPRDCTRISCIAGGFFTAEP